MRHFRHNILEKYMEQNQDYLTYQIIGYVIKDDKISNHIKILNMRIYLILY